MDSLKDPESGLRARVRDAKIDGSPVRRRLAHFFKKCAEWVLPCQNLRSFPEGSTEAKAFKLFHEIFGPKWADHASQFSDHIDILERNVGRNSVYNSETAKVSRDMEAAFGRSSELVQVWAELPQDRRCSVGYACLHFLAKSGSSPFVPITDLLVLSTRFLDIIGEAQFDKRSEFLGKVARQLTNLSDRYEFSNEEGRSFDGKKHLPTAGSPPPSPSAPIRVMKSFLVTHRNTQQTYRPADVRF